MLAMAIAAIENEGDRALVEALYTDYYALMLRKAQSMVRERQAAEDVVEAVMLRLIDKIELLRGCNPPSLRSYLIACVRNEAIDRLRREGRWRSPGDADERLNHTFEVTPGVLADESAAMLRSFFASRRKRTARL